MANRKVIWAYVKRTLPGTWLIAESKLPSLEVGQPEKKVALPDDYATTKPKRLRFTIFTPFGQVVRQAGQMLLRIANQAWNTLIGLA